MREMITIAITIINGNNNNNNNNNDNNNNNNNVKKFSNYFYILKISLWQEEMIN